MDRERRKELDILFDGSFEGFLCVVYAYYYEGILPLSIQTKDEYQPSITQEEFFIVTDEERALKVQKAIGKKISHDAAHRINYAFLADAPDRFINMLRYIVFGFKVGFTIENYMNHDFVLRVHKLSREVGREGHKLVGFCRFAETDQGIYYCAVTPINYVLPILAEHFAERMINQSWIIHDKKHNKAVVYNGYEYAFVEVNADSVTPTFAGNESHIQNLWVTYFNTLAIEARKNPKLHRQMLPIKYRGNMVEFITRS
jgi:probable DNA metabolism protein